DRPPVLAQDPGSELRQRRVSGHEDAVLQLSGVAECALDPPCRVPRELDPRLAHDVADLPRRPAAVLVDVELRRNPEVAFATCRETDVTPDPRDAERADVLAVEILADHVPAAVVGEEAVGIDGAFGLPVAGDRVVRELDRALLRDRALELPEAPGHLGRVIGVGNLHAYCCVRCWLAEAGASECEVLEREAERLRIGELSLEEVE